MIRGGRLSQKPPRNAEPPFWHNAGLSRILAATVLLLALPACMTPNPADEADRLSALVAQLEACTDAACRSDAEGELLELAQAAAAAAGRARNEQRRIGHLRVAGLAAWQSGEAGEALAARVNENALTRCRTLDELARGGVPVGAPDDCAVLETLPTLVAHASALRQIATLATAAPGAREKFAFETLVADYPSQTFLLLGDLEPRLLAYEGLSPATARWLVATRRSAFCDYRRIRDVTAAWPGDALLAREVEREFRRAAGATGKGFDGCDAVVPIGLPPSG